MQLTAVEFARLINDLKCDVRTGERRTNPRAPTRALVEVIAVNPADTSPPRPQQLRVRDISRTGMGLLTNRNIAEHTPLIVLLPKTSAETFWLLCEVVRTQRLPGDLYHIGTRMIRRLTQQEFDRVRTGVPGAASALLPTPAPLTGAA